MTKEELNITADRLAAAYIRLRDKRAELKVEFEKEDEGLKQKMETLSGKMLELCKDMNADSIKTSKGTISRSTKTRYWIGNWEEMYDVIKRYDVPQLLEQRIHQGNMKKFLEEFPEAVPRGLNVDSRYEISVRKVK